MLSALWLAVFLILLSFSSTKGKLSHIWYSQKLGKNAECYFLYTNTTIFEYCRWIWHNHRSHGEENNTKQVKISVLLKSERKIQSSVPWKPQLSLGKEISIYWEKKWNQSLYESLVEESQERVELNGQALAFIWYQSQQNGDFTPLRWKVT